MVVKLPFTWQLEQATVVCAPVSGNAVLLWLKVDEVQLAVLWHRLQSCGKPLATWLGLVVCWNWVKWHDTQVVGSPTNTPLP
jgi:hypothetical protein